MSQRLLDEKILRSQAALDGITHISTGVAVFRGDRLLVVRRAIKDEVLGGEWELPGGGVDSDESIQAGAARELFEETGLKIVEILGTFQSFDYSTPRKPKVRQINFKVLAKGEVKLDPNEHDDFRWITNDMVSSLKTNKVMEICLLNAFEDI